MNRDPVANSLLAALPRKEYQHLLNSLEPVTLAFGEILYEPGKPIRHVYFPCDSLVSLLTPVDGHMALEIGLVGREGMLGIPLALGVNDSPVRALVRGAGTALRMKAARFRSEHEKYGSLHSELSRYIHEQILNLDSAQKQAVFDYLYWNSQPANGPGSARFTIATPNM